MIATEAGAEGINLQFCSLVVNYDLPWNPQRIEQRIGRCHRYGQKHDVVVVNFLNRKNAADRRVYELLSEKFQLFEGVFGASDEVLGAIESGVDFEKRIADIYQRCRKHEEIKVAFDQLQLELNLEINESMTQTRRKLLENFDDEVREKLRVRADASVASLNRLERSLMRLTAHELNGHADFLTDYSFRLKASPFPGNIPLGLYELPRRSGEAHLYRLNHPLAEAVLAQAKFRELPIAEVRFNYEEHGGKITILEPLLGCTGWLSISILTVEALDQAEDHLLFSAVADSGEAIDPEQASRLFLLYNYCRVEYRDSDGKLVPEESAAAATAKLWVWREISPSAPASKQSATTKDKDHHNYRYYRPSHPKTGLQCPHPRGGWKFPLKPDPESPDRKSFTQLAADNRIAWGDDEAKVPQTKGFLHEVETNISTSAFYEYNDGEAEVAGLFGSSGLFLSPKSSKFVRRFVAQTTTKSDWVVDCFGGSGSTAHSVISFNRETHGNRKYVTCEMGTHFETLIVPRLKKVVYSSDWKEGKPQAPETGVAHAFKIVRLEGYEDTLNNLHLGRTPEQEVALAQGGETNRDQYLLDLRRIRPKVKRAKALGSASVWQPHRRWLLRPPE